VFLKFKSIIFTRLYQFAFNLLKFNDWIKSEIDDWIILLVQKHYNKIFHANNKISNVYLLPIYYYIFLDLDIHNLYDFKNM